MPPTKRGKSPRVVKQTPKGSKQSSGSVLSRISNIEFDENEGISINIYGRSGTGKTTFWGSFPGPILSVICSGGKRPGELRSLNTPEMRKKIKTVTLESPEELLEVAEYAEGKFQTVVIDHATGLYEKVLANVLGMDKLPEQSSWGLATREQYGQATLQTKELLRSVLDLSCNRVIIAQEREFGSDSDNAEVLLPYVGSALPPSLTGWLNTACDYIVNTFIRPKMESKVSKVGTKSITTQVRKGGVEYCLRVGPHDIFTTKFRTPNGDDLPELIVNPTYQKLSELI